MTGMDRASRARTAAGVFISLTASQLIWCTPEGAAQPAPKVVATVPAAGATVPAGPLTLKVTFDQKMMPDSYSFVTIQGAAYPPCPGPPTLSTDGMTFSLDCTLESGKSYALGFNGGSYMNFKSQAGVAAVPSELHFSTAPVPEPGQS